MRYSKTEMIIAWEEALERKLCDMPITEEEEINFQEALEVYFEHLSCNDMKHIRENFISLLND